MRAPIRSWLFVPALDPRRMDKAAASGADAVIVDLEDAVAPDMKAAARGTVSAWLREARAERPELWVRVNQVDGRVDEADVAAIVGPALTGIVVPKAEDPQRLEDLAALLGTLEGQHGLAAGSVLIAPLVETPRGVEAATALGRAARGRTVTLMFGAVDYLAQLGVEGRTDGPAAMHALARVAVAAAACDLAPAVDTVFIDLDDEAGLRGSMGAARDLGCFGKLIIHPRQLAGVHEVLAPTPEQVAWATRVVAAFDEALAEGRAALLLDGRFIDLPVVASARRTLALAQRRA